VVNGKENLGETCCHGSRDRRYLRWDLSPVVLAGRQPRVCCAMGRRRLQSGREELLRKPNKQHPRELDDYPQVEFKNISLVRGENQGFKIEIEKK